MTMTTKERATEYRVADRIGRGNASTGTTDPDAYGAGFTGTLYDRDRRVVSDAATLRRILRRATGDVATPLYRWGVSVRYESFAGGCAIRVRLTPPDGVHATHVFPWANDHDPNRVCESCGITHHAHAQALEDVGAGYHHATGWGETPATYLARKYADRIHAALNLDDSDMMTDYFRVKFYGHITVTS